MRVRLLFKYLFIVLIVSQLSGCSSKTDLKDTEVPQTTVTHVVSETFVPTPSPMQIMTMTPAPSESSTETEEASQQLPEWSLKQTCIATRSLGMDERIGQGLILFSNDEGLFITEASLTETSKPLFDTEDPTLDMSPDGTRVVITRFDLDPPQISVIGLDGRVVSEFSWNESYPEIQWDKVYWITSQWLATLVEEGTLVISPTTGERWGIFQPPDATWYFLSPDLSFVVQTGPDRSLLLVDLRGEQELLWLGQSSSMQFVPAWSPSGSLFIFPGGATIDDPVEELFMYKVGGGVCQATNLAPLFKKFFMQELEWSHNERYIAGWADVVHLDATNGYDDGRYLFLIDLVEHIIIDYCINYEPYRINVGNISHLSWSADDKYLIVTTWEDRPELILDVNTGEARALPVGTWIWSWALKNYQ